MKTRRERKKKNMYYEISSKPKYGTAQSGLGSLFNEFLHSTSSKELSCWESDVFIRNSLNSSSMKLDS
jgi:hypothetical protein